ncbi:MAG: ABC transporter permease [Chloroflexota bacterium]
MRSFLVHVWAFFIKEIHDVRRQPRLMLSLVGGPLLVLAVFGATFRSSIPRVRVVLVWPEDSLPQIKREPVAELINRNFRLYKIVPELEAAMQMLETGEVDVVQVMPEPVQPGGLLRPQIQVFSRTIDPATESWIRSLSYRERTYLNQLLLLQQVIRAQQRSGEVSDFLDRARQDLSDLEQAFTPENQAGAQRAISQARGMLQGLLTIIPAPPGPGQPDYSPELSAVYWDAQALLEHLNRLEQALHSGNLAEKLARLSDSIGAISQMDHAIQQFKALSPEDITSPVQEVYTNLRGGAYELVVFFAPAVLAMLVQHLGVTLAALAFVRERQMGAFEMFRVAPLNMLAVILGKTLAYTLYVALAGAALSALLLLLRVPAPQDAIAFAGLLTLVALASVGIGFLISVVAATDSQAVQLTMLTLLLSIFFSGFFLPISGFLEPAWVVTYSLPMTYAIDGFQSLLLEGRHPPQLVWLGLLAICGLSFSLVAWRMQRAA